ncbi:MAG: hypothetical protein ABIH23_15390, partial [bacterium]
VEEALREKPEPVGVAAVDQVIESLGTPEQWIPDIEIPPWKKAFMQLREGPEDYRLGYFSLLLLLFGLILAEISIFVSCVLVLGAFCMSRAAIHIIEERGEEVGAQKWLLYPALILVYMIIIAILISMPWLITAGPLQIIL